VFQCLRREDDSHKSSRLSVIASRRVGNAVKRNYGKRMLREIFRNNQCALPSSCDVVIILRSGYDTQSFTQLEARYLKACANVSKSMLQFGGEGSL